MKHLLNNLSEEEKNSIREQHEGGMKLDTSRFRTLLEGKSGNVKPLVENEEEEDLGFDSHSGDFDDSEDEGYGEIFDLIDDECVNSKNDDDCVLFLNTIIEYCEDKLYEMGQYGGSDEDELDEMVGVDYMSDELEEDFDGEEKPLNLVQRFFMYNKTNNPELSDIPEDEWDEFIDDMSDETTSKIMADIMRYRNPEFKEFEEKELGYAQHDGGFDGDDSEFEDEDEELDLREFDDLEEDDETW